MGFPFEVGDSPGFAFVGMGPGGALEPPGALDDDEHACSDPTRGSRSPEGPRMNGEACVSDSTRPRRQERANMARRERDRRHRESVPHVEELCSWVEERTQDVEPKSALGKALGYIHPSASMRTPRKRASAAHFR